MVVGRVTESRSVNGCVPLLSSLFDFVDFRRIKDTEKDAENCPKTYV